jgi:hypothetical protein
MIAVRNPTGASQANMAAPSATAPVVSSVDPAWLAQAIEVRKVAYRLYRLHLSSDLPSSIQGEVPGTEGIEDADALMAGYLSASEKLFLLTAAVLSKERPSASSTGVDNSNRDGAAAPSREGKFPSENCIDRAVERPT